MFPISILGKPYALYNNQPVSAYSGKNNNDIFLVFEKNSTPTFEHLLFLYNITTINHCQIRLYPNAAWVNIIDFHFGVITKRASQIKIWNELIDLPLSAPVTLHYTPDCVNRSDKSFNFPPFDCIGPLRKLP